MPRDAVALCPSVRTSVRLSQVGSSTETAKHMITQTTPHDSPGLQFSDAKDLSEFAPTRAPYADGVGQNRRLSTNSSLYYLENDTK